MTDFTILVNTTDSFEDCWIPFFELFKKYWPDFEGKIYLNTEQKDFSFKGLNIICIKNQLKNGTWGQCLQNALLKIEEEAIVYFQEDYFLNETVDSERVNYFKNILIENNYDCIHLTDQCSSGPFNKKTKYLDLWELNSRANYRTSLQVAFWNKDSLSKLIRKWESPWQFEYYASRRSKFISKNIFCANQEIYGVNKKNIISYIFTGIIRGKWNPDVIELFKKNNLNLNFSNRGFYDEKIKKTFIQKVFRKLNLTSVYCSFKSSLNIFLLKHKIITY